MTRKVCYFLLIIAISSFKKTEDLAISNQINLNSVFNSKVSDYTGKPWNNKAQEIPGKIECEFYDLGGEAIAFHDKDTVNNGSGKLNPADGSYLNEFRMNEAVDISYTKARDIDNSPFNVVEPVIGDLYVGWTMPEEWINYTINVNSTGYYSLDLMYTANGNGGIIVLLDGDEISSEIVVPSTNNSKETIAWRQWHHWNKISTKIPTKLKRGKHVLTLKTITNGNMNYDYLDFKLLSK